MGTVGSGTRGFWQYLRFGAFLTLCVALGGFGWFYVHRTAEQLLETEAFVEAGDWADYLTRNLRDLPAIARGEPPSLESVPILDQAWQVGRIYLFRVYDAKGRLKFRSDDFRNRLGFNQPIEKIDRELAAAVRGKHATTLLQKGRIIGDPTYFASSVVPVMEGQRIAGWLAIHIDQSGRHALFLEMTAPLSVLTGALLALGPMLGFWYRTRQKIRAERRIRHLEQRDPMTGLANRGAFIKQTDATLSPAKGGKPPTALIKIELGGLEAIDQALGHDLAERAVAILVRRLMALLPQGGVAARLDNRRLAVLLTGVSDPIDILRFAKEVAAELSEPVEWQAHRLSVQALAGIALAPSDGATADDLLHSAGLALDLCRQPGSPGYGFFNPEIVPASRRRIEVQRALNEAVARQSFHLEFQPVYRTKSGELIGFEALMRLVDPMLGSVPPTEFIPAAEQSGLISRLGGWCLEEACRIASEWPAHLVVAVNLSPAQFYSGTLIADVHKALELAKFPAYRLEVEITEGTLLHESEVVIEQLRILREMGVAVVLDDFGTGYSSLSYLWKFPFSKIKIDRAFVAALDSAASARGVMRSIVRLGRGLGMSVTAEGIETDRQLVALRELGCELVQGFLLGRPARVEDVAAIILRNFALALPRPSPAGGPARSGAVLAAGNIPS